MFEPTVGEIGKSQPQHFGAEGMQKQVGLQAEERCSWTQQQRRVIGAEGGGWAGARLWKSAEAICIKSVVCPQGEGRGQPLKDFRQWPRATFDGDAA